MGLHDEVEAALAARGGGAKASFTLFKSWCGPHCTLERRAGMSTFAALAYRISCGRSVEETRSPGVPVPPALAIKAPDQVLDPCYRPGGRGREWSTVSIFGAPHTIGM